MKNTNSSVEKTYGVVKSFTLLDQSFYEGEILAEGEIFKRVKHVKHKDAVGALSGLVHRGILRVQYETPVLPNQECKASESLEQKIEESQPADIQHDTEEPDRLTKHVDVSLKDQSLVDQADKVKEDSKVRPRKGK